MAKLVVEKGRDKGKLLVLKEAQVFLVGRDIKTHLKLRDHQASRRHLKITTRAGEALLEDLDSSNGTFVNGERVRSWKLANGDKVMVGETLIFYLEDESEDSVSETQAVDTLATTGTRKGELTQREVAGYRVGRLLGRGGMGTVYEAIQVSLERRVAFKVLANELAADPQFVDRFTAEARAAGSLNHPNLVQVYDVGFVNQIRFYSMEYMAKGSVEDLLRKHGKLPVGHALAVAFDAARGLEYAERKGIVHRDIKPENLMISEDDVVKIGDLGIATQRRPGQPGAGDETISGSPHYIAPEQALGKSFDHRADLYALGVSLYQILCGETPFDGMSAREVILKHLHEPPPPLGPRAPGTAPEVLSLVERLMEKDPAKRPPSASVLLQELVPLLRQHPITEETAARVDGFLSKRLELSMQGLAGAPRSPSGREAPVSTATSLLPMKTTDRAPLPPTAASARPGLVRKVLLGSLALVGAVAFGAGLFTLAATLRARSKRIHDEDVALIASAQTLLDKSPRECERDALALEQRFAAAGQREDAQAAHELSVAASHKRILADEAEREARAESALADSHRRVAALAADPADQEGIGKLKASVTDLEEIAKSYPRTKAGDAATVELKKATDDLARAEAARVARLKDEATVEAEAKKQWSAMEDFCRSQRFDDACLLFQNFRDKHPSTPARKKATQWLHGQLALALGPSMQDTLARSRALTAAGEFERARRAVKADLKRLETLVDFTGPLKDELVQIDRAEEAAKGNLAAADEARLVAAANNARGLIKKRRFNEAAAIFAETAGAAQTPEGGAALAWRAERLRTAWEAISHMFASIHQNKEAAAIHADVPVDGRVFKCIAYDADETTLVVRFHDVTDPVTLIDVSLEDVLAAEVVDWVTLTAGPRHKRILPCVALALELGERERGQKAYSSFLRAAGGKVPDENRALAQKLHADLERAD